LPFFQEEETGVKKPRKKGGRTSYEARKERQESGREMKQRL